jgi:serralysin
MSGGTGNDTYVVDNIGDSITEKSGIDTIESSISYTLGKGLENLTLTGSDNIDGKGNTAANVMIGNSGQNTLNGDRGDDILDGGAGHDILTGGLGADRFVFSAATFDGVSDTITDFSVAQHDRLDIHDLLAGFDPLTSNLSDFVQVTNNGVDSFLIIDADGTGSGSSPVQVALLANVVLADETSLVASGNLIVS